MLMGMGKPPQSTDKAEADDSSSDDSKEVSIELPEGMKTPEGHADGDTFEGTFRGSIKDGKLCFQSVNNIPVGDEDEESPEEEASESPEEESSEDKMGMDAPEDKEEPMPEDEEDKKFKRKKGEESSFKKAFHS